jgi:hypothetical protein
LPLGWNQGTIKPFPEATMTHRVLLLILVPTLAVAADASGTSSTSSSTRKPASTAAYRSPAPTPRTDSVPIGVDRSDTAWRLDAGYGATRESLKYTATASPDSPTLAGYSSTSHSASSGASAGSVRIDVGPMYGVHPASRGESNGFLWGIDLAFASYKKVAFDLPATDADTTGTSANGTTFQSQSTLSTYAVGLPIGWAWDLDAQWSIETLGFFHLGILHAKYTSGENLVYGKGAPLPLFSNDLYNAYFDLGAKANLAYRFENGWEMLGTVGYLFGQSFKGTIKDAVTFYQGTLAAQTGSYKEELTYKVNGAFVTVGGGCHF